MKKIIILVFITVISLSGFSQNCLENGLEISRQSLIDSFNIYYPGCETIEGFIKISGSDITDLSGLSQIKTINGYLIIEGCNNLTSISGLENLTDIGQFLLINDNS